MKLNFNFYKDHLQTNMSEIEGDPQRKDTQQYPHIESVPLKPTFVAAGNLSGLQFVSHSMNTSDQEAHTIRPSMSDVQKQLLTKQAQNPKGSYPPANATNFAAFSSSSTPKQTTQSALSDSNGNSRMKSASWQSINDIAERKIILKAVFHNIKIFRDALDINYDRKVFVSVFFSIPAQVLFMNACLFLVFDIQVIDHSEYH